MKVPDDENDTQLKVGIIGTGFGSVIQYPGFQQHPLFDPIIISGKYKSKTERIGARLGIDEITTNWTDLLDNPEIDVISIATPPNLHKEMAIAALEAGKHVLCEKPLALNTKEAEQMLEAAEDSGLVAMLDLEFRYMPSRAYMAELINTGFCGEIYQLDISIKNPSRLNPRSRGYNWWSDKNSGGGILAALGSHYIDFILLAFGQINAVVGKTNIHIPKRLNKLSGKMVKVTADDSFTCLMDIGNSAQAHLKINTTTAYGQGTRIEVYGSEGTLVLLEDQTLIGGKIGSDKNLKQMSIPRRNLLERKNNEHNLLAPFKSLLNDFSMGVKRGSSPHPNFEDGLEIQKVIDAIRQSNDSRSWISIEK
ncbi:MAG: Gfo/Idh/MocA family protein [Candidatus Kariarchaeaceae archaeon]|jgi:predicted dehydrogenase